jgi:Fe(3+) dicitrate transport protein
MRSLNVPSHFARTTLALALLTAAHTGFAQTNDEIPTIVVIGNAEQQSRIGGAATVITADAIQNARAFNINEVLRKAPGVFPREEEGFGLRPNIGIRGLNPTRSSKVLLLEDGLPLAYSPYGDNASYYHPTIERFTSLEVLKGSAQIGFGPHTVGGVVNYLTPNPSQDLTAKVRAAGGNAGYSQLYAEVSNTFGSVGSETGVIAQFVDKASEGARDNMDFAVQDYNIKLVQDLGSAHSLTLKFSRYDEDSDVPYSGLTALEYATNARGNPFIYDNFTADREGQSLVHHWLINDAINVNTAVYHSEFHRDWWRQSSNSAQRPSDSSDPTCGNMSRLLTTCGTEGRLRDYDVFGVEPRLQISSSFGTFNAGLRWQEEEQRRLQINADTPNGRTPGTSINGGLRENNRRDTEAKAWFIEHSFFLGDFTVTPGVRHEDIDYSRLNLLNNTQGATNVSETLAGLGVAWQFNSNTVVFAGVHEGFSPPRVEQRDRRALRRRRTTDH